MSRRSCHLIGPEMHGNGSSGIRAKRWVCQWKLLFPSIVAIAQQQQQQQHRDSLQDRGFHHKWKRQTRGMSSWPSCTSNQLNWFGINGSLYLDCTVDASYLRICSRECNWKLRLGRRVRMKCQLLILKFFLKFIEFKRDNFWLLVSFCVTAGKSALLLSGWR